MYKLLIALLLLLAGCSSQLKGYEVELIAENLKLEADESKIINSRDVEDIRCTSTKECTSFGTVKAYDYITEEKLKGEFLFDNSNYTNAKVVADRGTEKDINFYVGGDHFYKDPSGEVYRIKKGATTTIEAWDKQTKPSVIDIIKGLFVKKVLATDYEVGDAGSGYCAKIWQTTWADAHDALTATACGNVQVIMYVDSYKQNASNWSIFRVFAPVDTSAIDDGATISAASFNIWVSRILDMDNDGNDTIGVYQTTMADPTSLATADFDTIGTTPGGTPTDMNSLTDDAINTFTFDATGIGFISKTGWTKLGVREGHDVANVAVDGATEVENAIDAGSVRNATAAWHLYLSVTVSAGGAPASYTNDAIIFE
jgi:hypothetical protein